MAEDVLANKRKGLAVASLVLGLCGLLTFGLKGIGPTLGLLIGAIAITRIHADPGYYGGKGFAISGLITNAISLLLAIAVFLPGPLTARLARNEASAFSSLLSIRKAELGFRSRSGRYGSLTELADAGLLGSDLATVPKDGYLLEVVAKADSFEAMATPLIYRDRPWRLKGTGQRSFYINELGVIHEADKRGNRANADDPPLD